MTVAPELVGRGSTFGIAFLVGASGFDPSVSRPGPLSPWGVVLAWVLLLALVAGLATIVVVWTLRHGGGSMGRPQPQG